MTRTLFFRRAASVIVSAIALSACGSLIGPSEPPPQLYVLHPALGVIADAPQIDAQITVSSPVVSAVLDTRRIALMRGQTMDYYANAAWTDQTSDLLQGLLVEALEKSGKAKAVGRMSSGVRPDYIVVTEVRDFTAHYDSENGAPKIVVDIVTNLVTATRHDVIGTLDARREAQASANSVPATVDAFALATSAALEDIAGFVLKTATPPPAAKPDDPAPSPVRRHRRH